MNAIEIKNLSISYNKKKILNNINLKINEGEVVAIIGNNGAGKTSLLNSIIKSISYQGEIKIFDQLNDRKTIRQYISFVPQISKVISSITVWEYVSLAFYGHSNIFDILKAKDKKLIDNALKKVNIYHLKDKMINCISGGEMQKASLALGLVYDKKIIILDEPINHLDLFTQKTIEKIIYDLKNEGKTILIAMHDLNKAAQLATKFVVLKDSEIKFNGVPDKFINNKNMSKVFNVIPEFINKNNKKYFLSIKNNIQNIYVPNLKTFLKWHKNNLIKTILIEEDDFAQIKMFNNEVFNIHLSKICTENQKIKLKCFPNTFNYYEMVKKLKKSECKNLNHHIFPSGKFKITFKDKFNINWVFVNFNLPEPSFLNLYSSQLPALLKLGFKNITQREQRERNYFAPYLKHYMFFKNLSFCKYYDLPLDKDYILLDNLDIKYNKPLSEKYKNKIFINYGWTSDGQSKYKYENNTFSWEIKNDLYKQYMFLVKSFTEKKLIDFALAEKIGKDQKAENALHIKKSSKLFAKYQGKTIGFIFHWISKGHYFKKENFDPKHIIILAPSFLPFVYKEFGFEFPEVNISPDEIKAISNKYGLTDFSNKKLTSIFQKSFDIIFYIQNDKIKIKNSKLKNVKKMLKSGGRLIKGEYGDFVEPVKSLFGIPEFIKNMTRKLK